MNNTIPSTYYFICPMPQVDLVPAYIHPGE